MTDDKLDSSVALWLVHGTWGRRTKWVQEGSTFRRSLTETLGDSTTFYKFSWTGRNSMFYRKTATDDLIAEIKKEEEVTPHDKRYVIAHSHGGNIAVMAALQSQGLIDGVITLNTPFIKYLPLNIRAVYIQLIFLFMGWMFLASHFGLLVGQGIKGFIAVLVVAGVTCLIFYLLTKPYEKYIRKWFEHGYDMAWDDYDGTFFDSMYHGFLWPSEFKKPKSLCLCTLEDEAYSGLSVIETILSLPRLFLHRIALIGSLLLLAVLIYFHQLNFPSFIIESVNLGLYHEMLLRQGYEPSFTELLSQMGKLDIDKDKINNHIWQDFSSIELIIVFAISILYNFIMLWFVISVTIFVTGYLIRGVAFGAGFNMKSVAHSLITNLKISLTPILPLDYDILMHQNDEGGILRHTEIYNNFLVLQSIADWIKYQNTGIARMTAAEPKGGTLEVELLKTYQVKTYQESPSYAAMDFKFINSSADYLNKWTLNIEAYDANDKYLGLGAGSVGDIRAGTSKVGPVLFKDVQASEIRKWEASIKGIIGIIGYSGWCGPLDTNYYSLRY